MGVETKRRFASVLEEKLKAEDPWLPPRPWESIPTESGPSSSHATSPSPALYNNPLVSESSLIRIALNGLQGMESALSTIEKLSAELCSVPADGTFLRNPSIWKRSTSTLALGRILKSIGCSGCVVFLLRKLVDHFENLHLDNQNDSAAKVENRSHQSLVNHAFSVAVRKLLGGFVAAVDTLYASVNLRHSSKSVDISSCSSLGVGSLMRSEHSEVTLLEVYLHSEELRIQIDVIGNICRVRGLAFCFGGSSFEDLTSEANLEFLNFPRGGDLLSCLYSHLREADPAHSALLKFLFIRSCEPYCEFIRSWIYKAEVSDPYKEFMVEYVEIFSSYPTAEGGNSHPIWLKAAKERDGVVVPCFLEDICIPIFRAGQQLQVVRKLLELSGHSNSDDFTCSDILPCWSYFSNVCSPDAYPFSFNRISIEAMALARSNYYRGMMGKMGTILEKLGPRFRQVVSHGSGLAFSSNFRESQKSLLLLQNDDGCTSPVTDNRDVGLIVDSSNSEASSSTDEFPCLEDQSDSSDCSSLDGSGEHNEFGEFVQLRDGNGQSALEFLSSGSNGNPLRVTCNRDTLKPGERDSFKLREIVTELSLSSANDTNDNDQFPIRTCCSSGLLSLPSLNTEFHSNPLSRNPALFKSDLLRKREKSIGLKQFDQPPCFDFSSFKDPFKSRHYFGTETTIYKNPNASAPANYTKFINKDRYDGHEILGEKNEFPHVNIILSSDNKNREANMEAKICGGGSWEGMLSCSCGTVENSARVHRKSLAANFDLPLDFVIEKCLLQEIFQQYWYISKLTIKLLEEGFSLLGHFSALRRYHFMELADWADLFIVSLWNQKWDAFEPDRMVSEIQGLLTTSLQKSSCERDDYKDRLFVYMKSSENNMMPSLTPKIGIASFNFLGLGYRVDWPISIVVTDGALKIYAQIFSFLLRLKLAVFALTDTWCLMKETKGPQSEKQHLNILTTVRHQVNHFVTTLQQYVQSQLSHVSWCRYTDSLENKVLVQDFKSNNWVKDMMDLELVHMAYLDDSLDICFLSDEMKVVANIIENIMQCAIDLRYCLIGTRGGCWLGSFPDKLSRVDISQALAVKGVFEKNLVDLHTCYLTTTTHREFGIAKFWGLLNYNDYYIQI